MKLIPYNTNLKKLILPEYGRNVQQMIDYCVGIADRDERTQCAYRIVDAMATLFPEFVGNHGDRQKLWDHLNIMSGFSLDVDFPYDVVTEEETRKVPHPIPYSRNISKRRQYGKNIQLMVDRVASMDESPEKEELIYLVATQMKKLLTLHIKEGASNERVAADLADMSEGRILLAPDYRLPDFVEAAQTGNAKKKKKK